MLDIFLEIKSCLCLFSDNWAPLQSFFCLYEAANLLGVTRLFPRPCRQTIGAVYSDGSKALPEAMDKILEDWVGVCFCRLFFWGPNTWCFSRETPHTPEDNRASVVTSNWLPTGAQAAMSSTQVPILEPNGRGGGGEQ